MDREEFTLFYTDTFHRLVGQLYAMTGDHAEAQDAVQEAFVRAWARRNRFERDGAPESWIRVTAWRIAVSHWRRSRNGSRLMRLAASPDAVPGPSPDRIAFVEALSKVPADQRRALVLYHLCDLSIEQIAAETGARPAPLKPGYPAAALPLSRTCAKP